VDLLTKALSASPRRTPARQTEHNSVLVMKGIVRALLLATEGTNLQYRVLRCAADFFDTVFVLGATEARLLRLSRWCAGYTSAKVSKAGFGSLDVKTVNHMCKKLRIDVVLPSDTETTRWLAQNGPSLAVQCYPVPSVEVFDTLHDKYTFGTLCGRLGVPVPATVLLDNAQRLAAALGSDTVRLPAVVKPLRMYGSTGVFTLFAGATSPGIVAAIDYAPVLVQDYVPGRDISAFFACRGGELRAAVIYEKTGQAVHFFRQDQVVALARRVIEHFVYDGVIGFDIRERPDGALFFLECNPRFVYSINAPWLGGLNFVELGFDGGASDVMRVIYDVWVPSPWALFTLKVWTLNTSVLRLAGDLVGDIVYNAAIALRRLFGLAHARRR
jgi:glutathione synthase/RimK-type ligase-like ATP-grasp enzyme